MDSLIRSPYDFDFHGVDADNLVHNKTTTLRRQHTRPPHCPIKCSNGHSTRSEADSQVISDHTDPKHILILPITRLQEYFGSCVPWSSSHLGLDLGVIVVVAVVAISVSVQDLFVGGDAIPTT
jgi:hypothetical protein